MTRYAVLTHVQGEFYACALSSIYTFGPTFRAEYSYTGRHLAEFWMIEPEIAFCDLDDDMRCAEDYVRFCCKHLLEHCRCEGMVCLAATCDAVHDCMVLHSRACFVVLARVW